MPGIEDIEVSTLPEKNSVSLTEDERSTVQLSLKSHCYTWNINEFSHCLKFRNCQFSSPKFVFQDTEWRLRLCVITENGKVKNIKILLKNVSKIEGDLYFKNNISILGEDGKVLSQAAVEFNPTEENAAPCHPVYLLVPWGSDSFVLPDKLIVRSEFSSLISEECKDAESSQGRSHLQNVTNSQCDAKDKTSIVSSPKRRTRRTSSPRDEFIDPSLQKFEKYVLAFCVMIFTMIMYVHLEFLVTKSVKHYQNLSSVPSYERSEIDDLIYDSTKKLNLIAEALNLTSVHEKSLELLAVYSKIYNSTDHEQHVKQNIGFNLTESLVSKISSFVASEVKQFILRINNDTELSLTRFHSPLFTSSCQFLLVFFFHCFSGMYLFKGY